MNLKSFGAALAVLVMSSTASADLAVVTSAPSGADVLVSRGDGVGSGGGSSQATFGYRNADGAGEEGSRGRGQSFVIDAGVGSLYDINSLTLALANSAGNGTRGEGDLILSVFQYDGTGATAADQVNDSSIWTTNTGGTSGAVVFTDSYEIAANSSFANTAFVEFTFDPGELQLSEDTAYGFFLRYTLDSVAGLTSDFTIAFDADLSAPGDPAGYLLNTANNTSFASAVNGGSETRDLNYFITGTAAVPEPGSIALLAFVGAGIFARRRRS